MNVHPILYSFRRCPYAMRARMALINTRIKYEHREIILRNKPIHMLAISPKGTVPVLLLPDQTVIEESIDIMHWAIAQNGPDQWISDTLKKGINARIKINDEIFKPLLDRYKYPNRYADEPIIRRGTYARDQANDILTDMNEKLANNQHLCAPHTTIADIAIFPFIRQFAHVDKNWFFATPHTNLQKWLTRYIESDLFKTAMTKHPLWQEQEQ